MLLRQGDGSRCDKLQEAKHTNLLYIQLKTSALIGGRLDWHDNRFLDVHLQVTDSRKSESIDLVLTR